MRIVAGIMYAIAILAVVSALSVLFIGCADLGSKATSQGRIHLYWENTSAPHPERAAWSDALVAAIEKKLPDLSKAKDIGTFCPKFGSLDDRSKVKAFGELFVAMANFESGYKPGTEYRECDKSKCRYGSGCSYSSKYGYCMKGSSKYDEGMVVSRGLLQMSISSSLSYGCELQSASDLHDPIKNLNCAVLIMTKQIARTGLISGPSNYWAVIKSSNSRNHLTEIKQRVQKYAPACIL